MSKLESLRYALSKQSPSCRSIITERGEIDLFLLSPRLYERFVSFLDELLEAEIAEVESE